MVSEWLNNWMLASDAAKDELDAAKDEPDETPGERVAAHFSDTKHHGSHGRRIDRDEARKYGLVVEDLEQSQELQDAVLRTYHLMTVMFERSNVIKIIRNAGDGAWLKAHASPNDAS